VYKTCKCPGQTDHGQEAVTIPAGEACAGLCADNAGGSERALNLGSLPVTIVEEQIYSYGFCPSEALQRGTLFPELVG